MNQPFYLVDAFAPQPFMGNPAAVYRLPQWREDRWLQLVAREMNQAETAFVVRSKDSYELRWFTPTVEVDLCGHATLATAHVLWESGQEPEARPLAFASRSGTLVAKKIGALIELDFPLLTEHPVIAPQGLAEALGIAPMYVGLSRFDLLVEAESEQAVRSARPNFSQLLALGGRGIIVTARSDDAKYDFVSRFFAPAAGIDEDPATGSAHCCLASFWQARLGKSDFVAYQASPRGGVIHVRVQGDRAILAGQAITIAQGSLLAIAGNG